MKPSILIVDDIHTTFLEQLTEAGYTLNYQPDYSREDAEAVIANYDGLVIRSKFQVDRSFLDLAAQLTFIARGGAGMDNIDEAYAAKRNITLLNAPEGNRDAVGEHMMGMLLSLMNHLQRGHQQIIQGTWAREQNRGFELAGKTVALIGYGNNGQAMAKKLSGFEVEVIAYDKYKTGFTDAYAREVSMEEVVRHADILSFHIPLTSETKSLVNTEYLYHFKKPFFLLMGARGGIVEIPAVLKALDTGKILGAAFDVLPVEKFPPLAEQAWYPELVARENVLLSPHVAGWTFESYVKIADVLAKKIIQLHLN
ncbi:phosphoglycerate dehydrogenase [Sphingobacteriaceae bacterium WQ 2009]|uniref:Phosphoglycerate dehydrogenase n=1 Tax=Rhinopithecimicrobium faecis TaxID=2820698 RepID=A0A8T4H8A2_9SPHI|nr:phosphoglycerate dehydrogenase [Sphingobacteriaceae bacterium WQ 2009]